MTSRLAKLNQEAERKVRRAKERERQTKTLSDTFESENAKESFNLAMFALKHGYDPEGTAECKAITVEPESTGDWWECFRGP